MRIARILALKICIYIYSEECLFFVDLFMVFGVEDYISCSFKLFSKDCGDRCMAPPSPGAIE
jgi:hypothetical protein